MAITKSFRKAVEDSDLKDIRIMLKESLLVDPTFVAFDENSLYSREVDGIYVEHDGRDFVVDKTAWNDDYMDKLMSQLMTNFSHERVNHLKDVVKYLRPVSSSQSQSRASQSNSSATKQVGINSKPRIQQCQHNNYQEQKKLDQHNGNVRVTKITAAAVIGGVIGGTIASVAGGFIVGVAIGAVAGTVVANAITKGE